MEYIIYEARSGHFIGGVTSSPVALAYRDHSTLNSKQTHPQPDNAMEKDEGSHRFQCPPLTHPLFHACDAFQVELLLQACPHGNAVDSSAIWIISVIGSGFRLRVENR